MKAKVIMNLEAGPELDGHVTAYLQEIDDEIKSKAWSSDRIAQCELLALIGTIQFVAGIMIMGDAPKIISEMATIGEEGDNVSVFGSEWGESLCKALLLYVIGCRGDYFAPEWEQKASGAKKRIRRVK